MRKRFAVLQGIVFVLLVVSALVPATFSLASEGSPQASVAEGAGSPAGSGSGGSSSSVSPLAVVPAAGGSAASGSGSDGGPALAAQSTSGGGSGSGSASGGAPALSPQSTTIPIGTDGKPTGTSGTGWSYGGTTLFITGDVIVDGVCTCAVSVGPAGTISGGTFNGQIISYGTISGGTFNGQINSYGMISSGTFNGSIHNNVYGTISGGTFNGSISNGFYATISGGTFNGSIDNGKGATISGGTIYGPVQHANDTVNVGSGLLWGVTRSLANVTSSGTATTVASDATLTEHLTAAPGYTLPQTVTVTLDGVAATAGTDYTWDPAKGTLTIPPATSKAKMGPITITAAGTITSHSLTVTYDGPSDGTFNAPARHVGDVAYGTAYSVASPDVAGYTPDKTAVEGTMGTSDVSETVTYSANTSTPYKVAHYKQAVDGTYGTDPDETDDLTGTTGQTTAAVTRTYEGFTAQTFSQDKIAGDGSTVVKVYYARDSHSLTVTYDGPSDGTFNAPARHVGDVAYGTAYSVTSPDVTGYTPDRTAVEGTMGTSDVSETVTYAANAYTVAFDADGGTGSMAPMAFAYGTAQDLAACGFTAPVGYHFAGWAASAADAAAGTVAYADGASVGNLATAQDAVVTLFAVWAEDANVTITYVSSDATRGTVAPGSESLAPATGEAKGAVATALPGYRFVNWTVSGGMRPDSVDGQAAGSALATQSAGSSSTAGSAGSSAGGSAGTSNSAGTPIVLGPNPSATVAGTDPTLTPAQVDAVAKASGAYVATTFTANFEPITYSVAYNANGGSGTMSPTTLTYGTAGTLAANAFTREGHTFSGWNTMPDGTGTSFADGASVSDLATVQDATVTLYAQWTFVSTPTPANPTTPTTKPGVLAKTGDVAGPVALGLIAMMAIGVALLVVRRRRA